MSLQFEDCVDCIQALYPNYTSIWMFDHSCGHDRGREDGLLVNNMQVMWGGKQKKLRSSQIIHEEGFLGPHSPKLKVGDIQHMVFSETDEGPYYLKGIARESRRYDEVVGEKVRKRLKEALKKELEQQGVNTRGKVISEIQAMCLERDIPITSVEQDIQEGWVGKAKGIKQVAWERGLLDPNINYVGKISSTDPNFEEKIEYRSVLADCFDFINEKTCLMFLGEKLGVEVDRSTKSHPELAGEGIEYSWGRAKSVYRKAKLCQKKGKENFKNLVSACISEEEGEGKGGLTPEMIRRFSRRARHYILAYFYLEHDCGNRMNEEGFDELNIERVKKEFKTHRSAIDFDEKFINHCYKKRDEAGDNSSSHNTNHIRRNEKNA